MSLLLKASSYNYPQEELENYTGHNLHSQHSHTNLSKLKQKNLQSRGWWDINVYA